MRLLEEDSVARHDDSVEGESRLGAVPIDEFADGVFIRSLRAWRREAVKYCRFRLFKVGKAKDSFRVVFSFGGHAPNLPNKPAGFPVVRAFLDTNPSKSRLSGHFHRLPSIRGVAKAKVLRKTK